MLVPKDTNGDGLADNWFRDDNADGVNDLLFPVALPELRFPEEYWFDTYTPQAMNDTGQIVLQCAAANYLLVPDYSDSDGEGNPWYADLNADGRNDLMIPLPELEQEGYYYYADAQDINGAGQIVENSREAAVLWQRGLPGPSDGLPASKRKDVIIWQHCC